MIGIIFLASLLAAWCSGSSLRGRRNESDQVGNSPLHAMDASWHSLVMHWYFCHCCSELCGYDWKDRSMREVMNQLIEPVDTDVLKFARVFILIDHDVNRASGTFQQWMVVDVMAKT